MARGRVRIVGDDRVIAQLREIDRERHHLTPAMRRTGAYAVGIARSLVPFAGNQLIRSITFDTNSRSRLTLVAGGDFVFIPALGVWGAEYHNGSGRRRDEGPRPFLETAARMSQRVATLNIDSQIASIIRRAGLS